MDVCSMHKGGVEENKTQEKYQFSCNLKWLELGVAVRRCNVGIEIEGGDQIMNTIFVAP